MQPNSNRPVYIVQPSNITHLNVRPTIITTGGQQLQTQPQPHPVYQISTIRQQAVTQQPSPLYQVQGQPRLVSSTPVYNALPTQRFSTSPQTIVAANANISPRLITPPTTALTGRIPMATSPATLLRPTLSTVSTPPMSSASSPASTSSQSAAAAAAAAASGSKEFSVRVPK